MYVFENVDQQGDLSAEFAFSLGVSVSAHNEHCELYPSVTYCKAVLRLDHLITQ
jgi:hypothetical protein